MRTGPVEVTAVLRTETSKAARREVRTRGLVPAIVNGRGLQSLMVAVDEKTFTRLIPEAAWYSTPLRLNVEGMVDTPSFTVMISAVQKDPVTRHLLAVDFHTVSLDQTVRAQVSLRHTGQSRATRAGAVVEHLVHQVTVEARPTDIPDHLTIDISELEIGAHVRIADVPLPPGVTLLAQPDEVVLIVAHRAAEEVAAAPTSAAVVTETPEPELVRPRETTEE